MGQIVFWGTLTMAVFLHTIYDVFLGRSVSSTATYEENFSREWRFIAAAIMEMFWFANVMIWMIAKVDLMFYTDMGFLLISLIIFYKTRLGWVALLTSLYGVSVGFDVGFKNGWAQADFAWWSNVVYTLQLLTVVGLMGYAYSYFKAGISWVKHQLVSFINESSSMDFLTGSRPRG
jgi:hypothetical protein